MHIQYALQAFELNEASAPDPRNNQDITILLHELMHLRELVVEKFHNLSSIYPFTNGL